MYNVYMNKRYSKMEDKLRNYIRKTDKCWLWTGDKYSSGYGRLTIKLGLQVRAHRFMYEQRFGKIPEGMFALHKCDVRACVNPEHIFIGTKKDNMQDCVSKGRNRYKTLKGTESPNSNLNKKDITEIRELYKTGKFFQREIGHKFGVSQVTVSRIILGYSYK